uniref:Uncharacterized protein n=1 Tax=Cannabis sativa TaxID=3483 RepID=A0A803PHA0_CANSA
MAEDDESDENNSDDLEDDHQDTREEDNQDAREDNHQDMPVGDNIENEGNFDESDSTFMVRKLKIDEDKLSLEEQFSLLMHEKRQKWRP